MAAEFEEKHKVRCRYALPAGQYEKIFPGDGTFLKVAFQFFVTYILPMLMQKYITPPVPAPAQAFGGSNRGLCHRSSPLRSSRGRAGGTGKCDWGIIPLS